MRKFDICMQLSGIISRTVEAETEEEAEEIAKSLAYGQDWNDMSCPEVDVLDVEVIDA